MKSSPLSSSPRRRAPLRRATSTNARLQDRIRRKARTFFLERLEERSLLATMIWQGGSGANMSTAANWIGNVAPAQDDQVIFPAGANTSVFNDLADGMRLRSITISGPYSLGGHPITLVDGVTFNAPARTADVSIPLTLGASASITSANVGATLKLSGALDLGNEQTLTTQGMGDIELDGIVSGSDGSGIIEAGRRDADSGGRQYVRGCGKRQSGRAARDKRRGFGIDGWRDVRGHGRRDSTARRREYGGEFCDPRYRRRF